MSDKNFYKDGLKFACTQCSKCCRHDPGFVYLSEEDLSAMVSFLSVSEDSFIKKYCHWVYGDGQVEVLSLKEKSNYDCIFWEKGKCSIYQARPLQCRTFPFWHSILRSKDGWNLAASDCPGMNTGTLYSAEEIDRVLRLRKEQPYITRKSEQ